MLAPQVFLGDKHDFNTPEEFLDWAKKADIAVMLPLYLYDHSGLSISTEGWRYPFNDPWDAGQVGWIFVTKHRLRKERGIKRVTKKVISWAEGILRSEVETYDQYLCGEVYGFTAYEIKDAEIVELDSCGRFFGDGPEESGMLYYVPKELEEPLRAAGRLRHGMIVTEAGKELKPGSEMLHYLTDRNLLSPDAIQRYQALSSLIAL